jgi:hypothetical protein
MGSDLFFSEALRRARTLDARLARHTTDIVGAD